MPLGALSIIYLHSEWTVYSLDIMYVGFTVIVKFDNIHCMFHINYFL